MTSRREWENTEWRELFAACITEKIAYIKNILKLTQVIKGSGETPNRRINKMAWTDALQKTKSKWPKNKKRFYYYYY